MSDSIFAAECNFFDCFDKFLFTAFLNNMKSVFRNIDFQVSGSKCTAENNLFRILRNIDETAASGDTRAETADIDIAGCIALCKTKKTHIQSAAVIKIKLIRLIPVTIGINSCPEAFAVLRNTADGTGFNGQCNLVRKAFFFCNGSYKFRNTHAEIDNASSG